MWLLAMATQVLACSADLTPGSLVGRVRILAVRSEPAEVAPGETTQLSALVAVPAGDATKLTLDWALCTAANRGDQVNASPDACADLAPDPALFTQAVNGLAAEDTYALNVPLLENVDPAALPEPDGTGGVYLPIRVVAFLPGQQAEIAIYRLRLNLDGEQPNQNPQIDETTVTLAGNLWAPDQPVVLDRSWSEGGVTLEAHWQADSVEGYTILATPPIAQDETLRFSWFVERGALKPDHTGGGDMLSTVWKPAAEPTPALPGDRLNVWLVLRDDRGGTSWVVREVVIPAP